MIFLLRGRGLSGSTRHTILQSLLLSFYLLNSLALALLASFFLTPAHPAWYPSLTVHEEGAVPGVKIGAGLGKRAWGRSLSILGQD